MRTLSCITTIALSMTAFACSSINNDPNQSVTQQPIINGWKASARDYPSIAGIASQPDGLVWCSGTYIAHDVVLTAAHCVYGRDTDKIYVTQGIDEPGYVTAPDAYTKAAGMMVYPGYADEIWDATDDIAIIVLENTQANTTCVPILKPDDYRDAIAPGAIVRIVGYGRHVPDEYGGQLYAGDVPVTDLGGYEITVGLNDPSGKSTGACFGDSGGPAYVTLNNARFVTGVTSRDASGLGECGRGTIYTLPGSYIDWIDETMQQLRCLRDNASGIGCQPQDSTPVDETKLETSGPEECSGNIPAAGPINQPASGCNVRSQSNDDGASAFALLGALLGIALLRIRKALA